MHRTKNNNTNWQNDDNKQLANKFADSFAAENNKIANSYPRTPSHVPEECDCKTECKSFESVNEETIKKIKISGIPKYVI